MKRWESIQCLRAVAAGLVFIGHLLLTGGPKPDWLAPIVANLTSPLAHGGVDLFFVISGAIMYLVTKDSYGGRLTAINFLIKRVMRVYPLFWIALAAMLIIRPAELDVWAFVMNLLLITPSPHLNVAWTLTLEMRFYLIVGLALVFLPGSADRRFLAISAFILALVSLGAIGVLPPDMGTRTTMLEFVAGAGVAALVLRTTRYATLSGILGLAWLTAALFWFWPGTQWFDVAPYRVLMFGVPSALILYSAMAHEQAGHIRAPRWAILAGDMSYSTYLWHLPIIIAVSSYWPRQNFDLLAYNVTIIALVTLVSIVSWHVIERPSTKMAIRFAGAKMASVR